MNRRLLLLVLFVLVVVGGMLDKTYDVLILAVFGGLQGAGGDGAIQIDGTAQNGIAGSLGGRQALAGEV